MVSGYVKQMFRWRHTHTQRKWQKEQLIGFSLWLATTNGKMASLTHCLTHDICPSVCWPAFPSQLGQNISQPSFTLPTSHIDYIDRTAKLFSHRLSLSLYPNWNHVMRPGVCVLPREMIEHPSPYRGRLLIRSGLLGEFLPVGRLCMSTGATLRHVYFFLVLLSYSRNCFSFPKKKRVHQIVRFFRFTIRGFYLVYRQSFFVENVGFVLTVYF